jgi:GTP-binding protein HflX
VPVSAARRLGIDKLMWAVSDALSRNFLDLDIETGVDNGRLMAYLAAHGEVMSSRFNDTRVVIHCRLPQKHLGRVTEPGTVIRRHETNGNGAVGGVLPPLPAAQLHAQS